MTLKQGGQAGVYPLCEACHVEVEAAARRMAISGHTYRLRECALINVIQKRVLTAYLAKKLVRNVIEPCRLELSYY
jgi:hypothetical protein